MSTPTIHVYSETIDANTFVDRILAKRIKLEETPSIGETPRALLDDIADLLIEVFHFVGSRGAATAFVEARFGRISEARAQLARLLQSPGIAQRTPEWYATRRELITASDFGQALGSGKFGTPKQFFAKKCGYEPERPFNALIPPLKWGVMFEPVANEVYCHKNGVRVHEFGLLRHPTVPYLGASPDGITDLGVMVEIKCPYKRKIDGTIPSQYFHQIQGQLEVCGLTECDYLECEFVAMEWDEDPDTPYTGLIAEFRCDGAVSYEYFYAWTTTSNPTEWLELQKQKPNYYWTHRWRLGTYRCSRVYKDEAFVADMVKRLGDTWNKIIAYRNDRDLYVKEIGAPSAAPEAKREFGTALAGYSFIDED